MNRACLYLGLLCCTLLSNPSRDLWAEPVFAEADGKYQLLYPRDHGAHPDYETEWWYVTGHLAADTARTFGFELVFFRVGVQPELESKSAWRTGSLYLSHFALTDDASNSFQHFESRSRGSFSQAGADLGRLHVWNRDSSLEMIDGIIRLRASADDPAGSVQLTLELKPAKPLVLHGENGFSRKGPNPGEASYYSSFTRLTGAGTLATSSGQHRISKASAWLDQEFSSSKLSRGTQGWDWFAVQLQSGEELMVYYLRDAAGKPSAYSSGTWVRPDGSATHLAQNDFVIESNGTWLSPHSGKRYPSNWTIRVPKAGMVLEVVPTVADQELSTGSSTNVTYWEGRSKVTGSQSGKPVAGDAYVELVGY